MRNTEETKEQGRDPVERYLPLLVAGDAGGVVGLFAGEPMVRHPMSGRFRGAEAVEGFVGETRSRFAGRHAEVEHLATTRGHGRTVVEAVLRLAVDGRRTGIPVAVVGEHGGGGLLDEVRVYHSTWPLTGSHQIREPLLEEDPAIAAPDVVGEYQEALAEGDLEKIVATFGPDGYAREPAGDGFSHRGRERLRGFYAALFSNGGGIPLDHCSLTDDGTRCAVEYNVVRWGRSPVPPQAGVAVYERGGGGLLAAARIYDDLEPPLP